MAAVSSGLLASGGGVSVSATGQLHSGHLAFVVSVRKLYTHSAQGRSAAILLSSGLWAMEGISMLALDPFAEELDEFLGVLLGHVVGAVLEGRLAHAFDEHDSHLLA